MRSPIRRSSGGRPSLGPRFARFWLATAAASLGSQISDIAIPLLAVLALHASAGEAGLVGLARWLPFLLLALPMGVLVDRHRRLPLLICSDATRAALVGILVILAVSQTLTLPTLLALVAALGALTVVFDVAYQSFLPAVVSTNELGRANSRLQSTVSASQVVAPGAGGWLVQTFSAPWALAVQTLTYAISALALLGIGAEERQPLVRRRGVMAELREGLGYVRRDRYLVSLVGFSGIYNLFAQWIMVLFLVHAVRSLGLSAGDLGLVFSLGAVGAVVGAALAPSAVRRLGAGAVLVACAAAECVALAALPFIDAAWSTPVVIAVLVTVFLINGAGTALSSVVALTLRQLRTPDHLLGRVNASMRWLSYGLIAIGAGAGGLVGDLLGTRAGLAVGGAGLLITIVWVVASPLRRIGDPTSLRIETFEPPTRQPEATRSTPPRG